MDTSTAAGKAFFDMPGVFAQFETNLCRERLAEGHSPTQIARDLGISRGTVYQVRSD